MTSSPKQKLGYDELSAPLERRRLVDRLRSISVSPLSAVAGLTGLALVGLVGWLAITGDPSGGEPVAILKLNPPDPATEVAQLSANEQTRGKIRVLGGEKPKEIDSGVNEQYSAPQPLVRVGSPTDGEQRTSSTSKWIRIPAAKTPGLSAIDRQFGDDEDIVVLDDPEDEPNLTTGSISSAAPALRLARAPERDLIENTNFGGLPKVSGNRIAAKVYARPVDPAYVGKLRGRIAIVVGGIGLSAPMSKLAIENLPGEISLAFSPYGSDTLRWVKRARELGHEVLLQLPLEPVDYPNTKPGANTLLTSSSADENLKRLRGFMGLFPGYVAVSNLMGSKFTSNAAALGPLFAELKHRGVYFLDDGATRKNQTQEVGKRIGLGVRQSDVVIDQVAGADNIKRALTQLEELALKRGWAIGTATALPTTVDTLSRWEQTLQKRGLGLVPVTALY